MKILFLSPAHPLRGGIAASTERLAKELKGMGHEVVIYSFSLQYPGFLFPGKTQYSEDPAPEGLTIKTKVNSINPFNWISVSQLIKKEQAELMIVRFWLPFMAMSTGTIMRLGKQNARVIGLLDNLVPHESRPGDQVLIRYFMGACDEFVALSATVRDELLACTQKPVRYAPHPIYDIYGPTLPKKEARSKIQVPADKKVILFFGLIRAYKGLDLLLEALTQLPDIHAIIAGETYGDWSPYQKIINEEKLADRIYRFDEYIPNNQVNLYFSAADLVVQPYKSATQSGITQMAYHFEKPMVVTNVGGLPEFVADGESGFVVEPNPKAIAAAIREYFDQQLEESFTQAVSASSKQFSWEHLAKQLLDDAG